MAGAAAGSKTGAEARAPTVIEHRPPPGNAPDLDTQVAALRDRYDHRGWIVRSEPPFAVVGNGTPAQVEGHATGTIRWAVRHLRESYFDKPPERVTTIWLFETRASYEYYARELFDEVPDTPFGWYSPVDDALIMNIATGGGTLVHEIVHPFMAANFPACPSWFNEGLASLYEQSAERGGTIVGLTNWRLAGLQAALEAGDLPSFRDLCFSGNAGFYRDELGTNYAQARYLCYWLQEQGLLRRYYGEFRRKAALDATGYDTLVSLVGPDMGAFRRDWERFVMDLRYG